MATKDALIDSIFPDLQATCNYTDHAWLRERQLFLPQKNVSVDAINLKVQLSLCGNEISNK